MALRKVLALCTVSLFVSFSMNVAQGARTEWKSLNSIQRDVLKKYESKWNGYSEKKQKNVLSRFNKSIRKLTLYKAWFRNLTSKERNMFYKNKKQMSKSKFKGYVDTLIVKYGKPGN